MDEQTIGVALGLVLTLMIYSYILGDNPLYRIAVHVLVGVGLGYASIVVFNSVLIPQLVDPFMQAATWATCSRNSGHRSSASDRVSRAIECSRSMKWALISCDRARTRWSISVNVSPARVTRRV